MQFSTRGATYFLASIHAAILFVCPVYILSTLSSPPRTIFGVPPSRTHLPWSTSSPARNFTSLVVSPAGAVSRPNTIHRTRDRRDTTVFPLTFLIEFESVDVLRDLGQVGGGVVVVAVVDRMTNRDTRCPSCTS